LTPNTHTAYNATHMEKETIQAAWKLAETFKFGLYEHYKGGRYSAIAIVTHHETRMPMVVYVSHTYGGANVRPLVGWQGDADGFTAMMPNLEPRFRYIGTLPSDVPLKDRAPLNINLNKPPGEYLSEVAGFAKDVLGIKKEQ
jgi:hypothetical protein